MKRQSVTTLAMVWVFAGMAGGPAVAGGVEEKLGPDYAKASAVEKLVLLTVAKADDVLSDEVVQAAMNDVTVAEVTKGETAEARLKRLATLWKDCGARIKEVNKERKAAKANSLATPAPTAEIQIALALAYVAEQAGAKPTVASLECLRFVHECLDSNVADKLALHLMQDALGRDEAFQKADWAGKLTTLLKIRERKLLGELEVAALQESTVLLPWTLADWKAGKSMEEISNAMKLYKVSIHAKRYTMAIPMLPEVGKR